MAYITVSDCSIRVLRSFIAWVKYLGGGARAPCAPPVASYVVSAMHAVTAEFWRGHFKE